MMNEEKELLREKQAVLTTQRLIIKEESIKLSEILEAYSKIDGWSGIPKVVIRLKDGSMREFNVPDKRSGGSQLWGAFTSDIFADKAMAVKANVDRWVNLINRILASTPIT